MLAGNLAWHDQLCPVLLFCFGSPRREQAGREQALRRAEDDDEAGAAS